MACFIVAAVKAQILHNEIGLQLKICRGSVDSVRATGDAEVTGNALQH
jgi:hypothetical protein